MDMALQSEHTQRQNIFGRMILAIILAFTVAFALNTERVEASSGQGISGLEVKVGDDGATLSGSAIKANSDNTWNSIITTFHKQIAGVSGLFMLGALYKFAELAFKLTLASDNPQERARVQGGMVVAVIGAAILGASAIIFGFAYNLLVI